MILIIWMSRPIAKRTMTVCCPANKQHPAQPATRSNIPCTISKAATWKKSDTNGLDNLDEPAYCKEGNDSLLSS